MRILLTGAAGYTGQGMAKTLRAHGHVVRGFDIKDAGVAVDESIVGDLADLGACRKVVAGMEAMVMCHMAPNPTAYLDPPLAFDTNVKGTANLYHAAVEHAVGRCVLVSTTDVIPGAVCRTPKPGEGPYNFGGGLYTLTKLLQENIARYYYDKHEICTAILRPGWIVYDQSFVTKYGSKMDHYEPTLIDPRDIGEAAARALALPDLELEAFQLGQDDADLDYTTTRNRLGWHPAFRFDQLPRQSEVLSKDKGAILL